jgi:hypothetical protein
MPSTVKGLPYPSASDAVDVPGDIQALAEGVDTELDLYLTTASASTTYAELISEPVQDLSIVSSSVTFNVNSGNVGYISASPTANFTVDVTNAPTTNGKAITISLFVTQGATGHIPNVLAIAGTSQTIKWQGGAAPTPTSSANKIDVFSFTMVRRSSAWTVFGSALLNF